MSEIKTNLQRQRDRLSVEAANLFLGDDDEAYFAQGEAPDLPEDENEQEAKGS